MSSITKDQLFFDPAETENDNIGAYVRASDGTVIDKVTLADTIDRLAVSAALVDSAGNEITGDGSGALNANITNTSLTVDDGGGSLTVDGTVTVDSEPAIYAEDSAHTSGADGKFVLAVRNDANTSLVTADGDYAPLQVDASGKLKVASEVTVQAGDAEFLKGSVAGNTDALIHVGVVRQDTLAAFTGVDDGDYTSLSVDAAGRLYTTAVIAGDVADDAADSGNPFKIGSRAVDGVLSAVDANDRADVISDLYRRLYVNSSAQIAARSTRASVSATAAPIIGTALAGRRKILIQNTGNREAYIGGSAVTATDAATDGIILRRRTSIELEVGEDVALFAVCEAGEATSLNILEIA